MSIFVPLGSFLDADTVSVVSEAQIVIPSIPSYAFAVYVVGVSFSSDASSSGSRTSSVQSEIHLTSAHATQTATRILFVSAVATVSSSRPSSEVCILSATNASFLVHSLVRYVAASFLEDVLGYAGTSLSFVIAVGMSFASE